MSKDILTEEVSEKGFALVVVIVIMLLVSFLAGQLILNVRTELKVAFNAKARSSGLALAEAGVNLGIFRILDKPLHYISEDYETFHEGYGYTAFLPSGKVKYTVINESGKMDLNKMNESLLKVFLEYLDVEVDDQSIIIDSLYDWRDSDDLHRLNGAEAEYYEALEDPYIPRNGRILDPAEFFLVKGTDKLAKKFKGSEAFTVHNNSTKINFNSLTPFMLDFLVEGDEEKKTAYRDAKQELGTLNASQARIVLGDERFERCASFLGYSSANNKYYTVIAEGQPGVTEESEIEREMASENEGETSESRQDKPSMAVSVLFQMRGADVNYLSWQEGWL
ncbi:MAG: general secretion pathway protein GspK [Desulfobulbaceae bacterium]|uniref:General secretion pathway protein GspK n=1 Tax=Candidatus Desulfobia pelagia TaxID=2841692 RepID=A0A8J6TBN6_9BACT|nr:general secretion pathway protein GspK [Candidatus Desulfobia pelagia]